MTDNDEIPIPPPPPTAVAAAANALITGEQAAGRILPPEPAPQPADEATAEAARHIVPREAEETAHLILGEESEDIELVLGEDGSTGSAEPDIPAQATAPAPSNSKP